MKIGRHHDEASDPLGGDAGVAEAGVLRGVAALDHIKKGRRRHAAGVRVLRKHTEGLVAAFTGAAGKDALRIIGRAEDDEGEGGH